VDIFVTQCERRTGRHAVRAAVSLHRNPDVVGASDIPYQGHRTSPTKDFVLPFPVEEAKTVVRRKVAGLLAGLVAALPLLGAGAANATPAAAKVVYYGQRRL
jgi:hypothetical protein